MFFFFCCRRKRDGQQKKQSCPSWSTTNAAASPAVGERWPRTSARLWTRRPAWTGQPADSDGTASVRRVDWATRRVAEDGEGEGGGWQVVYQDQSGQRVVWPGAWGLWPGGPGPLPTFWRTLVRCHPLPLAACCLFAPSRPLPSVSLLSPVTLPLPLPLSPPPSPSPSSSFYSSIPPFFSLFLLLQFSFARPLFALPCSSSSCRPTVPR